LISPADLTTSFGWGLVTRRRLAELDPSPAADTTTVFRREVLRAEVGVLFDAKYDGDEFSGRLLRCENADRLPASDFSWVDNGAAAAASSSSSKSRFNEMAQLANSSNKIMPCPSESICRKVPTGSEISTPHFLISRRHFWNSSKLSR